MDQQSNKPSDRGPWATRPGSDKGQGPNRGLPRIDGGKLTKLLTLAMCGVLAGAVIAAAAFPVIGITGLTAKAASDSFENLPHTLKTPPIPQTSQLYTSDGKFIASFYDENRVYTKINEIPAKMQHAMVAAEDQRFYKHHGIDPQGMVRALVANRQAGEVTQGASTLTQQYVKQILQYSAKSKAARDDASAPTVARKLREARYAVALEKKYSKRQILERYLNIAFFGNNAYGIYAAAEAYFSKQPKDLTVGEAATIAGLVQSPTRYDPTRNNGNNAKKRRNYVLDRMELLHFVSKEEATKEKKEPITLTPKETPRKCENAQDQGSVGFFCGWFVDWWKANPQFGQTSKERLDKLDRGGYNIKLAIDTDIQTAAQTSIDKQISRNNPMADGIVVIEPGTGRVKAMAINRSYGIDSNPGGKDYPNTTNPLLSGSTNSPGYQAGSTFKMFTMTAALSQNIPLSVKINAPQKYTSRYITGPGPAGCGSGRRDVFYYCPSNASPSMTGTHTMWSGFGESVNTFFIQLEEKVGVKAAVGMAERLGITFQADQDLKNKEAIQKNDREWGSFTLGTAQVSPLEMADAYATIAARGMHCDAMPMQEITDPSGKKLPYANPKCKQVVPQDVADAAADAARCPVGQKAAGSCTSGHGGATAPSVGGTIKRDVAGKTGTTDNNNAAWFVGFTPNLAAAAFKANPDSPNTNVGNTQDPVTIFTQTMASALAKYPEEHFEPPTQGRVKGDTATVPDVAGATVDAAKNTITAAGFKAYESPEKVDSDKPAGTVVRTDPPGNQSEPKQSTITLYVSKGHDSQPSQPSGQSAGPDATKSDKPAGRMPQGGESDDIRVPRID